MMHTNRGFKLLVQLTALTATQSLLAQPAQQTIVIPFTMAKNSNLSLHNIVVAATHPVKLILSPDGKCIVCGDLTLSGNRKDAAAAVFSLSGQSSYTYAVTLPDKAVITDGVDNIVADQFTSWPPNTGTLNEQGIQELTVGATINFSGVHTQGYYSNTASVPITVNYN